MIPETINSIYPLFIGGLLRIIEKGVMGGFFFYNVSLCVVSGL